MKLLKFLCVMALSALALPANAQDDGLKIHISVDMEGLAGAVTGGESDRERDERPGVDEPTVVGRDSRPAVGSDLVLRVVDDSGEGRS